MNRAIVAFVVVLGACSSDDNSANSVNQTNNDGGLQKDGESGADGSTARCTKKSFPYAFADLCFSEPTTEGKRTQCGEIVDNCDDTGTDKPNLGCWDTPPALPDGPSSVALTGYVDVFSSGPDADKLTITVYDYDTLHAAVLAAAKEGKLTTKTFPSVTALGSDTVNLVWTDKSKPPVDPTRGPARACPADAKAGLPCVVPAAACGTTQPYCSLDQDHQYCHVDHCEERLRWEVRYRIENMPTNKRLVIRTHGPGEFDDGTWGVMLMYGVFLRSDAPACTETKVDNCFNGDDDYELEVNALSRADYSTIPITAGLSGGIPAGKGAVAGEVRDCDDIKLGGFQIATDPAPSVMVYFNGNPVKTLPDIGRLQSGSNADGLFAALDIAPGEVIIGAAGKVAGSVASAGKLTAAVLPDSVTAVAFDGPDPE